MLNWLRMVWIDNSGASSAGRRPEALPFQDVDKSPTRNWGSELVQKLESSLCKPQLVGGNQFIGYNMR